jgi:acyl-CoA thioesterase FadM
MTTEETTTSFRTRFEGSNICSWIGFKHVMYLVEEAVLEHLRKSGLSPRELFDDHGVCVEIVDSSVRILHALHMDDQVSVRVRENPSKEPVLRFRIELNVTRDGKDLKALTGTVKVLFRRDDSASSNPPAAIAPYTVARIERAAPAPERDLSVERGKYGGDALINQVVPANANAFIWKWHVPYFYCHFTTRIQHSGYLRLMEEVVDLFLADRGISIRTMLDTKRWIPVVPTANVEMLAEAYMEETIYTVYTVEDIFKNATYTSRMDCYVERAGALVHCATGRITHGYAVIENRRDWSLVEFDAATIAALSKPKNGG